MKRRVLKRRNPIALVAKKLRPTKVPSKKLYRRKEKFRDRLMDKYRDGLFYFRVQTAYEIFGLALVR